jgi:hypothetical protein
VNSRRLGCPTTIRRQRCSSPTYWHRACRTIALFSLALLFTSIEFEACAQTTRDHRDAEVEFSIATRDRLQGVIKRGRVDLRFDSQKKGDSAAAKPPAPRPTAPRPQLAPVRMEGGPAQHPRPWGNALTRSNATDVRPARACRSMVDDGRATRQSGSWKPRRNADRARRAATRRRCTGSS